MAWVKVKGAQNDGLYRHSETQNYKFRKYREGYGEIDRSLKTTDLTIARRKRDQLMVELWGDKPKHRRRQTNAELWPVWREGKLAAGKSDATMSSIDSSWKNLDPYAGHLFPDDLTEEWWLRTYIPRKREEISPRTKRANPKRKFMNERKWLLAYLNHQKRQGLLQTTPVLVNPDPPRDRAELFTDEEFERLLIHADWELMAKLVMGRDHFMRRSEVALLSWDRVDMGKKTIHLRAQDTKIRKARTFPFNEALECLFLTLKERQRKTGMMSPWVFPSPEDANKSIRKDGFQRAWRTCKADARVPARKKFHWLRHTGLTIAFKKPTSNPALVCHFAGLSLDEAMKTYIHFQVDDLRGVLL